ncbi:MAG TPA: hypothetical protein VE620_12895 [Myxococcales bacterium]|jgi:hypothetical protein|nr:hypothetical protein [Myxococcales bacterium]
MATYGSTYQPHGDSGVERRNARLHLKWSAIFGGGVLGWGILLFLSLLGVTIGLAAIEPYSTRPASGLDTGSAIWGVVALVLSSILGAYCVVRIAGERRKREAALHGAVSWGLSMIAGALLAFGATSTAARATAENPPRTTARTDANGNLRMSRTDRERLDEAKRNAAKAAGVGTAAAFLAFLGALLGAGLAAGASRGRGLRESLRVGRDDDERRDRELGRTSVASSGVTTDAADRDLGDTPTILPPTH